jgi:hypothetical protein
MGQEVEALVRTQQRAALGAKLYTVGLDGVRTPCLTWPGPFDDPLELVEQVEARALRQANALGGVHAFLLELVGPDGAVLGTEFFRVSAESFSDGRSIISEPANEGGMLAQMMRHNEVVIRTGVQGSEKTLQAAHKMIEQVGKRAEYAEAKFLEMLTTLHSVMTGERETQVAMVKAEARATATKQIAGKIASLIPEISAAFVKGNSGPAGAAHAAAISAKGLFSTITSEQLNGILGHLNVEQQMQLFGLMKRLSAEHEQQAAAEAAPNGGNNGAKH